MIQDGFQTTDYEITFPALKQSYCLCRNANCCGAAYSLTCAEQCSTWSSLSPPPAALFDDYLGFGLGACNAGDTCNRGVIYPSHTPMRKPNVCTAWNQMAKWISLTARTLMKEPAPHS